MFDGYAPGTFRARTIERAPSESMPFPFLAGGLPPAHAPLAHVRQTLLPARQALCVPLLVSAQALGVLTWGNSRRAGTPIHAAASKSRAIRDKRLLALASPRRTEVDPWCALTAHAEPTESPAGWVLADAIALRPARLGTLAQATAVGEPRAQARDEAAQAADDAHVRERAAPARQTGSHPRGRPPTPPPPGARDKDQAKGTAPASRLMNNSHNTGVAPQDKAQAAVAQDRCWMVAHPLATPPNDHAEAIPTVDALPWALGTPQAGALDHGDCRAPNIAARAARDMAPSIAPGRTPPPPRGQASGAPPPTPPPADASPQVPMASTRQTEMGGAISRLQKCPVAPVWGMSKEIVGVRPGSLRGVWAAAGAWCLVCLAFHLQRLHTLPLR